MMCLPWERVDLGVAGVFNTGVTGDWSSQFNDPTYLTSFRCSAFGELAAPAFANPRRFRRAIVAYSDFTLQAWLGNPGGTKAVQLRMDQLWQFEQTTPTQIALFVPAGPHVLELIAPDGGIEFAAAYIGGAAPLVKDMSLYPPGSGGATGLIASAESAF